MKIQDLKQLIEKGNIDDSLIIFVNPDKSDFIANQYINEISKIRDMQLIGIDEDGLDSVIPDTNNIFGVCVSTTIKVLRTKEFKCDSRLMGCKDLIVVCSKVDKDTLEVYNNFVVSVPKLEAWQIKDYAYSLAEGLDTKDIDYLISLCGDDIYRLDSELSKLKIFSNEERKYVFKDFMSDGIYNDLTNKTFFDFTNALVTKNIAEFSAIYPHLKRMGVEDMGLLAMLQKTIRNIILVKQQPNPTEANTGISSKQIWAIKKNQAPLYNDEQLYKAFNFLSGLDKRIKLGEIDMKLLVDYLIVFMLSL